MSVGVIFHGPHALSPYPATPDPTFSNVMFLFQPIALPWYDTGNTGWGVANYTATFDTGVKPSFAVGSLYTGNVDNHFKGALVVETGTTFALGTAFCLDAWVYCGTDGARIFDTRATTAATNAWVFTIQATTLYPVLSVGASDYGLSSPTPSGAVTANTWTHVRCSYDGTTVRIFVNGIVTWSATATLNVTTAGIPLCIANTYQALTIQFGNVGIKNQYLYGLRVVKGQALTTANFAPVTAKWPDNGAVISLQTNVTYSNVVLRSTYDANVNDVSNAAHTMTAAGNAQIDTSIKKFGAGSLLLDGTGDYVSTPDSTDFDMGTGDYQFQGWAYRNGAHSDPVIISCYVDSTHGYSLALNGTTHIPYFNATGDGVDGVFVDAIANVTWTHIAVAKKSGILYTFVDGVLQRFVADTQTTNCNGTMFIGRLNNSITTLDWIGNIDDIQLVKGECQLTRSFLVPTAALPVS